MFNFLNKKQASEEKPYTIGTYWDERNEMAEDTCRLIEAGIGHDLNASAKTFKGIIQIGKHTALTKCVMNELADLKDFSQFDVLSSPRAEYRLLSYKGVFITMHNSQQLYIEFFTDILREYDEHDVEVFEDPKDSKFLIAKLGPLEFHTFKHTWYWVLSSTHLENFVSNKILRGSNE